MELFRAQTPQPFNLPKRLSRLNELAYNLWWTWHPEAMRVLGRLDYDLWERLDHNPIRLLRQIKRKRLNQAAKDKGYLANYDAVFASFDAYFAEQDTWGERTHPELDQSSDSILLHGVWPA